ncbi:hypothetical protein UFOVP1636_266 [uncultured Caudovirales phage]|uniref:Uncharacterized protein n=1 Tax=uncultured Caudovirales phage TaxID=2100421 RepID=A0A6J5T1I4_9CAUD|nr:hypothetical protein UFOVP1636_266 [uncultured Caudovirales phage]
MITLTGLTAKQQTLCDIMWALEEHDAVEAFIATLPKQDQRECRTLIDLMVMAFADEIAGVDEAKDTLKKFTLGI